MVSKPHVTELKKVEEIAKRLMHENKKAMDTLAHQ